jgi:hypothetical protein
MQDDLVKMLADAIKEEGTSTDTGTINLAMSWDTQMFALKDGLLENGIACGVFATCLLLACWLLVVAGCCWLLVESLPLVVSACLGSLRVMYVNMLSALELLDRGGEVLDGVPLYGICLEADGKRKLLLNGWALYTLGGVHLLA